jgi:hypothetical protein
MVVAAASVTAMCPAGAQAVPAETVFHSTGGQQTYTVPPHIALVGLEASATER